jgi:hypothetical protein
VFAFVCPNGVLYVEAHVGLREPDIAGRIASWWRDGILIHGKHMKVRSVAIDGTGGYGAGVIDLCELQNIPALSVIFSASSTDPTRFLNLKAEFYWDFKIDMEHRPILMVDDVETINQFSAIKYEKVPNGAVKIESKEKYKARTGRSPDRAEAIMMGWYVMKFAPPSSPPTPGVEPEQRYGIGRADRDYDFDEGDRYQRSFDI